MRLLVTLVLLVVGMNCHADWSFYAEQSSVKVGSNSHLGEIEITGVGMVILNAQKNGNRLVVQAQDSAGKVIGKADSVIGLRDTPIHVLTPDGLQKITIYWAVN